MNDVTLINGDCLQELKNIAENSVDMVLCDPPYGIDYQSQWKAKDERKAKIKNDRVPFVGFIPELKRIIKPTGCIMLFTRWDVQQSFIDKMNGCGLDVQSVIIWDKEAHSMGDLLRVPGSRYESILYHAENQFRFSGKRQTDIVRCPRVFADKMVHPNEKPIMLLESLIENYTRKHDTVLDCTMGSGSTGVAAVNIDRNFIGIELDDIYFKIAKERIIKADRGGLLEYIG